MATTDYNLSACCCAAHDCCSGVVPGTITAEFFNFENWRALHSCASCSLLNGLSLALVNDGTTPPDFPVVPFGTCIWWKTFSGIDMSCESSSLLDGFAMTILSAGSAKGYARRNGTWNEMNSFDVNTDCVALDSTVSHDSGSASGFIIFRAGASDGGCIGAIRFHA